MPASTRHRSLPRPTRHAARRLLLLVVLAACTPPVRQFDLKDQQMSCDEANRLARDALQAMDYTITSFTPAPPGGRGMLKGARDEHGTASTSHRITVMITCSAAGPTVDASEDGKLLGQLDVKRGFYLAFTGVASQQHALAAEAKRQAALPLAQRKRQGFEALITPLRGLEARTDFSADLTSVGVLPVRVVINNRTAHRYRLDPNDIVLVRSDGERVHPLPVAAVMERAQKAVAGSNASQAPPDLSVLPRELQTKLFTVSELRPDSSASGYLFYPLDSYQRARVLVSESETEETEGFVVEF